MYFDYLREREPDLLFLRKEGGFAVYKYVIFRNTQAVYIQDIYVEKSQRHTGLASELSEEIQEMAKNGGVDWLLGTVCPSAKDSHISLKVLIAHGMTLYNSTEDLIWFYKEIK